MFFTLSKIVAFFAIPSNLFFLIAAAGVVLMFTPLARAGRWLALLGVAMIGIAGLSPFGNALILPLEQRFPVWDASRGAPDGIVILGGAVIPEMSDARGEPALNESAERMTVVADLARRYPNARILFSGGVGNLLGDSSPEAKYALPLFESFGIPAKRVELEEKSRNTAENATFSNGVANPKPGERWLLVTSAHHMSRSVGCFRSVGFPVEPYPVDWRTRGASDLASPFATVSGGLARTDVAVREWVGLLAYWLTGRIPNLFPAPN